MSDFVAARRFPTTQWSLVARLRGTDTREVRRAVEELFTIYRYPLYGYLRSTGLSHQDAEDVLQGFFEKMLRNDSLGDPDSERGRLRTFLLTSLNRFRLNWQRGELRRKHRICAEVDLWDVDEARFNLDFCANDGTPEAFYDRRWAAELVARVKTRLRQLYVKRNKELLYNALVPRISSEHPESGPFCELAHRLGYTENALRVALHRMRKDFRDLLLDEVRRTLDEGEDTREEIRHLLGLFEF